MAPPPDPGRDDRPIVAIYRSPLFNASESFVQAHAAGLDRYRPLLVGLEDKGNARPELRGRLVVPASSHEALLFKLTGRAPALVERLRAAEPRLVHAHFATDGLLALPLAGALGVPLLTTLHGYDVSRTRIRLLASGRLSWVRYALLRRRLIGRGHAFLAVSDAVRSQAIARGFPAERTFTHYLGIDLEAFAAGAETAQPGLVLHVGRLVEKKGTAILLDAFARVAAADRGAELVVIGDGPERRALERRAAALGLGGRVRFLGRLPHGEVAQWMRRAWVLAAPSATARDGDSEGLPTVVVEAAAARLPAVATDHAGIPEAVVDGATGFIVPERDSEALASRLLDILGSADLRRRLGSAARERAERRFDARRQNALLEERYDALPRQTRPRASR
ncbi:MAG TPA: glycosyltransferase [Allosphingosinicella sp.]|nr:glycosyltransferase [Allosphingosinicella sp.]